MIDAERLAMIQNFLFANRMLRTAVPKGTQFKQGEKEVAQIFKHEITEVEHAYLNDFFIIKDSSCGTSMAASILEYLTVVDLGAWFGTQSLK